MSNRFFLERKRNGEQELYEKDGTFENEGSADLLIATFHDQTYAEKVCSLLNQSEEI